MTKREVFFMAMGAIIVVAAGIIIFFMLNTVTPQEAHVDIKDPHPIPWMLRGVVLDLGAPGDPDEKSIESPTIVKLDSGTYAMWYRGQTYSDKIGRIMYATSPDGLTWAKKGVVLTPDEEYEGDKVDPMTVIYENGTYKMWYGGQDFGGCACYATSTDGINWTRHPGNPVLKKTSSSWDNEGAGGQHKVIKSGSKYIMYYKGYGSDKPGWVFYGMAESTDGIHWAKKGKALSPNPQIGESTAFRNMAAFSMGNNICIVYSMAENLHLFMARSRDGKNFDKNGLIFLHGQTPGGSDEKWSTSPCILVDGDLVRMWYEGGDANGRVRILYAEVYKNQFMKALGIGPSTPVSK